MAYRGGGSARGANNGSKRPNPSPNASSRPGSDFESQFAELASYNSPSTKRQRTNSGAGSGIKPGPSSRLSLAASRKSPLKFDFKSTRTTMAKEPLKFDFKPTKKMPLAPEESSSASRPKWVPRPRLPSQKDTQPPVNPPPEDLWEDDDGDCEKYLLAISQSVNPDDLIDDVPDEEELLAMTKMMEEDDFDFDDPPPPKSVKPKNDGLLKLPKRPDVFKAPEAPIQKSGSSSNNVEEVENYKKMHIKAQGEASILRAELEKQNQLMNEERIKHRKIQSNIDAQNRDEKKKLQNEAAKIKTEKDFLMQEMEQMKVKITKLESERVKESQELPPSKKRKALDAIKPDRNSFPSDMDFRKTVSTKISETQTEVRQKRKYTLKPVDKSKVLTLVFSKISEAPSDVLKPLFEQTDVSCLGLTLSETLKSYFDEISSNLPSLPSPSTLSDLNIMISVYDSMITMESRSAVTEICSKILRVMIKARKVDLLEPILVLIGSTWTSELLSQDITADIFTLLIELGASNYIVDQITGVAMKSVFKILSLVTTSEEHCKSLCKKSESDCPLSKIMKILRSCINQEISDDASLDGCESMSSWILFSLSMSHNPSWTDFTCPSCSKETIRFE